MPEGGRNFAGRPQHWGALKAQRPLSRGGRSKFAAQFHNRMPLVLEPKAWEGWLRGDADTAASLMKPGNEDVLVSRPVSKAVGNVKNNTPDLLDELAVSALQDPATWKEHRVLLGVIQSVVQHRQRRFCSKTKDQRGKYGFSGDSSQMGPKVSCAG
jgi:hypothetical protein